MLRGLAGPRWPSLRCLGVILRGTQSAASRHTDRDGARLLAGGSRLLTAHSRAHSRRQHAEAANAVEVDLKRLDGEYDGRDTRMIQISSYPSTHLVLHSYSLFPQVKDAV